MLPSPTAEPPRIESGNVTLRWPALPNAVAYDLPLAADAGFSPATVESRVAVAQFRVENLAPGRYHMRLRSVSQDGFAGPWGPAQVFEVPEPAHWKKWLLLLPLLLILAL